VFTDDSPAARPDDCQPQNNDNLQPKNFKCKFSLQQIGEPLRARKKMLPVSFGEAGNDNARFGAGVKKPAIREIDADMTAVQTVCRLTAAWVANRTRRKSKR